MHGKFWLTLGSLINLVLGLILVIQISMSDYFDNKLWCLMFIPIIIYQISQFISNYIDLTENNNKNDI